MSALSSLLNQITLRLNVEYREMHRWRCASDKHSIRVYYGTDTIAGRNKIQGGGIIKVQDIADVFPQNDHRPNLLYLVSSALPPYAPRMAQIARRRGAKVVLNQNGLAYPAWHGQGWEKQNRIFRDTMQEADYVIYQSQFCKNMAINFLGPCNSPSSILLNPVDTTKFVPPNNARPESPVTILTAGTHGHPYRIERAIQALGVLHCEGIQARLLIAGKLAWSDTPNATRQDIATWVNRYGVTSSVEILGEYTQTQAIKLFQQADILIHTQVNDTCPRLVVEALSCGLPVVYSATGGTPELVGPHAGIGIPGPSGWQEIQPPAPEALAQGITSILQNYPAFSSAARERAVSLLDVRPWIDKHRTIFTQLTQPQ